MKSGRILSISFFPGIEGPKINRTDKIKTSGKKML
jgi:hypothetical protein